MIGSPNVKPIHGKWDHLGYMTTEHLPVPAGVTLPRGTWLQASPTDDTKAILASGDAEGFTTQDIDTEGHTSATAQLNKLLGVGPGIGDWPIKVGSAVSVRKMVPGSLIEFEGLGAAVPGNLVCTSGTGSIAANAARKTQLSLFNGCIRIAQTGDVVKMLLETANLTPEVSGRRRIRVRILDGSIMP